MSLGWPPCVYNRWLIEVFAPPTFGSLTVTPGTRATAAKNVRPVGTASSSSRSITVVRCTLCTSTVGDSPETVTVSWRLPTLSSALTVAVKSDEQGHAVANEGRKPWQVEGHLIGARTQGRNRISSFVRP